MNKIITLSIALALASCQENELREEIEETPTNTCHCGLVTEREAHVLEGNYYLHMRSECSGNDTIFQVSPQMYNENGVGYRLCFIDDPAW
jgi:hypothetical protein